MTLPDTYACGMFNLPIKVAKIARLAEGTTSEHERNAARNILEDSGYFLDRVNILWPNDKVPEFAKDI